MSFVWARFLEIPRYRAHFESRQSHRGTHALILGVSKYRPEAKAHFGLDDLDCTARSALQMARWLVERYNSASDAPLASLRLLLSPSDLERSKLSEVDLEGVAVCTRAKVELALRDWIKDLDAVDGNVAVLYGAGHGMRYRGDGPLLLLEDFWSSWGIANALDVPKSNLGLDGLRLATSLIFADCCQQISEVVETLEGSGPLFAAFDPTIGQRRKGWGLYRAAVGGGSAYGVQGGTTYFIDALLEGLNGRSAASEDSGLWEVTTDSLRAPNTILVVGF